MPVVESEIHHLLNDLARSAYDDDQKAWIIAEAAFLFDQGDGLRLAKGRVREARLMDSLLVSMERNAEDESLEEEDENDDYDNFTSASYDAYGMSLAQIADNLSSRRGVFAGIDIVNDDDIRDLIRDTDLGGANDDEEAPEGDDDSSYEIEDGNDNHCPSFFQPVGIGKHRSDSLSHPSSSASTNFAASNRR